MALIVSTESGLVQLDPINHMLRISTTPKREGETVRLGPVDARVLGEALISYAKRNDA
jgi:hypothetical protein